MMKIINSILLLVFVVGTVGAILWMNRLSFRNEDVKPSTATDYFLSADDPILTYSVKEGEMLWTAYRNDGKKIFPEEFFRENPNADKKELKKARDRQEYNEWRKKVTGKLWYEAILQSVESGVLRNKHIEKELCVFVRSAWGEGDDKYKSQTYEAFVKRMKKQTKLANANLTSIPLLEYGYVSYHYRDKKRKVHTKLEGYGRSPHRISMLKVKSNEDLSKYDGEEKDFLLKVLPVSKSFQQHTGSEEHWSSTSMPWGVRLTSKEEGTFRVNVPLSMEAFADFYNKKELQKSPEHFLKVFEFWLNADKEFSINDKVKNLAYARNLSQEEQDVRRKTLLEEIEPNYDGDIEFIKAERRVGFHVGFAMPSGIKSNPNRTHWLLGYRIDSKVSENSEYEDVFSSINCGTSVFYRKIEKTIEYKDPYFLKYSWPQVSKCKPYKNWLQCHKLKFQKLGVSCQNVPEEEPEMCEA